MGGNIQTGPFGSQLHQSDYTAEGVPVIMPKDVIDDKINFDSVARIPLSLARKLKRHILSSNDILFPRRGDINKRVLVCPNGAGALCGTGCLKISVPQKALDPLFLYYFLKVPSIVEWIINQSIGATMENLNTSTLRKLEVAYPNLKIQKQIASTLSAYDELIEVNNQRIKLLEETARELYKEWFVRMRFPGYKKTKFKKGIPENWTERSICDIADITYGYPFRSELFNETGNGTPVIRIRDLVEGVSTTFTTENADEKYYALDGDIIVGMDGDFHYCKWAGVRSWINQRNVRFRPKNESKISKYFLYHVTKPHIAFLNEIIVGTTVAHLSAKDLKKIKLLIPSDLLLESFSQITDPMFEQEIILKKQNVQLRQIRDRLLPRLISGKLQVKPLEGIGATKSITPKKINIVAKNVQENKTTKSNPYFQRRVLAAYIIDRLKDEPTFGHVKLMKLMYLCEHLAAIETASHYHRDAAGPYDNQMIRSIDSQLKKAQWFDCKKVNNKYLYTALPKKEEYKSWFTQYYSDKETGIESLLDLFGKEKTEKAEMVATLYEAWRDLKEKKQIPSDKAIIHEVLNNWHESKQRIAEERWLKCLQWMKEKGWVQ